MHTITKSHNMVTEVKKDYTLHLDHGDHYGQLATSAL